MPDPSPSWPRPKPRPPRGQRIAFLAVVAAGITGYAAWGLVRDDLVLPYFGGGHTATSRGPMLHFHGVSAMAMAGAMACVALAAVVQIGQDLRTPVGRRVNQTAATWIAGAGFVAFLGLVMLSHLGAI